MTIHHPQYLIGAPIGMPFTKGSFEGNTVDRSDNITTQDLISGYSTYTDAAQVSAATHVETTASIDPDLAHPTTTVITTSR